MLMIGGLRVSFFLLFFPALYWRHWSAQGPGEVGEDVFCAQVRSMFLFACWEDDFIAVFILGPFPVSQSFCPPPSPVRFKGKLPPLARFWPPVGYRTFCVAAIQSVNWPGRQTPSPSVRTSICLLVRPCCQSFSGLFVITRFHWIQYSHFLSKRS